MPECLAGQWVDSGHCWQFAVMSLVYHCKVVSMWQLCPCTPLGDFCPPDSLNLLPRKNFLARPPSAKIICKFVSQLHKVLQSMKSQSNAWLCVSQFITYFAVAMQCHWMLQCHNDGTKQRCMCSCHIEQHCSLYWCEVIDVWVHVGHILQVDRHYRQLLFFYLIIFMFLL